jgi:HMW1C N-terminal/HMW1 domain 2
MEFNLERFENAVCTRQYEIAGRELMQLLQMLDNHYGNLAPSFSAKPMAALATGEEVDAHILTRIASAISALFLDTGFTLSPQGFSQALQLQRWLATLFAVTPFRNADHVLRSLNSLGWDKDELQLSVENLNKFALLAFPESEIPINLDGLWAANPVIAVSVCMLWLAPRFLASPSAHAKRELVLGWLPEKLAQMDLDQLPSGILHDVYMHCSYADRPDRHRVKGAINVIVRNKMLQNGLTDAPPLIPLIKGDKPTMLVVLEWFNSSHSIYRTHSTTMRAARRHFNVVAMGYGSNVDELGRAVFDEFIEIKGGSMIEQMAHIRSTAIAKQARVFYMPSVGMFPLTVFATNLRFAPLQVMALGHPATTHSTNMDYVVVEDDYVGLESCFSEKLLRLPKDALPYVPSSSLPENLVPNLRDFDGKNPDVVRIAVCATTMKLNPRFLQTLKAIVDTAKTPVHFEFMIGQATSLMHPQVNRVIKQFLGDNAFVNRHLNYPEYMARINTCDMFINPFPFGNTNGIIDTVTLGQVGVCLNGAEVFECIDRGLFGRLGVPNWMATNSIEEYIAAAVRLIDNPKERLKLRRELIAKNGLQILFTGRPEIFGDRLIELVQNPK